MGKNVKMPKIKEEKFFETNQKNEIVTKEENINSNQIKIKQKTKIIEKRKHIFHDKSSLKIENNNNIFRNKNKKNDKRFKDNNINFHNKFKRFYFVMILFIIPIINSTYTSVIYKEEMSDIIESPLFQENNQTNQTNQTNQSNTFLNLSEITLTLVYGSYRILSDNFFQRYKPYEIYINNSLQKNIKNYYNNYNNYNNYNKRLIFKIKWNISITMTNSMFQGCNNIKEIKFTNFNTSQIISMNSMFSGCSGLTTLNLSNFNTSQVNDMQSMFYGCSSLKSLNLSNFDTSQVTAINSMFNGCSGLSFLNLSNFNISQINETKIYFQVAHH